MTTLASATDPTECPITVEFFDKSHRYKVNGEFVPSVTTVLGMFDKPGIPYWVQTILCRNVAGLYRRRHKTRVTGTHADGQRFEWKGDDLFTDGETLLAVLEYLKLGFRDESKRAADRGLAIHTIFEEWGDGQRLPSPSNYPEAVRPYLKGLAQFLIIEQPEVITSEVILGSAKYGFAGRCDSTVVIKRRNGERVRIDLKTSKRVYPKTMFPQLEAYEGMDVEMHGPGAATDKRAIVHLGPDGDYNPERDFAYSTATFEDFLSYLDAYKRQHAIERRYREATKSAHKTRRTSKPSKPRSRRSRAK